MSEAPVETFRKLLLGLASEEEELRIEEAILAGDVEPSFLQNLEEELIDDYLLGGITAEERQGFVRHFLAVDERKRRVAFAATLVEYARKHSVEARSVDREPARIGGTATALFWRRAALVATAATVLLAALVSLQLIELRRETRSGSKVRNEQARQTGASSQLATLSSPPPGSLQAGGTDQMPTIEFTPATRGVLPKLLQIPAREQFVRFHAELPLPLAEKYREVVLSDGRQLWAQEFPVTALPARQGSTIYLPASILSSGLYHFHIESASAEGHFELREDYVFKVITK